MDIINENYLIGIVKKIELIYISKKKKRNELTNKCSKIYNYLFCLMTTLHKSYTTGFVNQENYNLNMERLEELRDEYSNIYKKLYEIKNPIFNIHDYFLEIDEQLDKIMKKIKIILAKIGTISIFQLIEIEMNIKENELPLNINKQLLKFYDRIFSCKRLIKYKIDEENNIITDNNVNKTTIVKYGIFADKNNEKNENYLDTDIIKYLDKNDNINIICKPYNTDNTSSLHEVLSGGKIYLLFPDSQSVLIINGIFLDDPLNLSTIGGTLEIKKKNLIDALEVSTIGNINFKMAFINQISIRDFIVFDESELVDKCLKAYKELSRLKQKTIAALVKEFLSSSVSKQRYMLTLFLMPSCDKETQYLAYLMYDMISQESYLMKPQLLHEQVFCSLHWTIKKLFKIAITNVNNYQNKLENIDKFEIPYQKRIFLLKCNEYIKSKAMEKLKEINSKNGDNCVKAQQYLDGLLRLPFEIFKKENILCYLQDFQMKIKSDINCLLKLNINNKFIENIKNNCKEFDDSTVTAHEIDKYVDFNSKQFNLLEDDKGKTMIKYDLNKIKTLINTFTTKKKCFEFITTVKTNLDKESLESLEGSDIFKSKIKSGKYTLQNIKEIIYDFFCNQFVVLDNQMKQNILNTLKISFTFKKDNDLTLMQLKKKHNTLCSEWNNYKIKKKKYLENVNNVLDKAVYGHEEAKNQITRLIGQWIGGEQAGYCFGFEGPPGCGKTSLAKQGLTQCLVDDEGNPRPFCFIPLGGTANGSTLEGHSYTYVGSTWGRIADVLMECKCMNPIIFIDELDKVSHTEHGKEIIGILTHLTDPSQNDSWFDKYFAGVPLNLSKAMIIFSYNDPDLIDRILLDRIHRVKFTSLKLHEKLCIAKDYMLPEIMKAVGFKNEIILTDEIIKYIIHTYTLEAGARKLKEKLWEIIREINLRWHMGQEVDGKKLEFPYEVTTEFISNDIFVDKPKVIKKEIAKTCRVGLVNGLYATATGLGGITIIECFKIPSEQKLKLELTGSQGEVMQESMKVAKTVAYNILPKSIKKELHKEWREENVFGLHIHCPEGATPKDGPSAGAAITSCIYSVLTNIPIKNEVAITGEIDLNGSVHAIGGLASKVQGAKSAGAKLVLCPKENKSDVDKIINDEYSPISDDFKIHMVETIWEVLEIMLVENNKDKPINYTFPISS